MVGKFFKKMIGKINKSTLILLISAFLFNLTACDSQKKQLSNEINEKSSTLQKDESTVKFPERPISIVVPFTPGGGTDNVARALADAAKDHFGQPIVVVNKIGGSGSVGLTEGSRAKPDGYTLTLTPVELTTLPHLGLTDITYRDFKPVLQVNSDPAALTVKADAPWNTVEEFLQYARKNPGKLKIGNSGEGAIWHLAAKAIEQKAGVKFSHVSYEGAAPAGVALLGGYIDAVSVSAAEVMTHVNNGQLKILGVLSNERVEKLPDVPTFRELGIDIQIVTWRGISVPKDTPDEIVDILAEGFSKAAQEDYFKDIMNRLGLGYKIAQYGEFSKIMADSDEFYKQLILELGKEK